MKNKKQAIWRYGFAIIIIISGLIMNYYNLGEDFLGFSSVGNWLIYVGFVMLAIATLIFIQKKKRIVDERSQFIGMKTARWTYVFIILILFITMVIDGVKSITIPYSQFTSMLICGITLFYFVTYKIIERKN